MKSLKTPSNLKQLAALVKKGEGPTLEFKRSTGELKGGMQTLCAFLNDAGGTVLFGVRAEGKVEGHMVNDQTLRDIAQALDKFEPPVNLNVERLSVADGREVLILHTKGASDAVPYSYEGRAYERIGNTTRKMPQSKYERLLLERGHAKRRWENLPAEGLTIKDLDRAEILRTRELAIQQNRISPDTSRDVGEIVDNRQEYMNAFAMVREGMAFLERTMPLGARFPQGKIFREDRFPVPLDALREILLNAVMHRDYSHYSGHVAIVIFDDRIEIRSYGRLPTGITIEQLSGRHDSKPTNPLIAGAFHRTGAVEVWGRGTNRVIAMCKKHGAAAPVFEEQQGFIIVTFKTMIVQTDQRPNLETLNTGSEKMSEKMSEKTSGRILSALAEHPEATIADLAVFLKVSDRTIERNLKRLQDQGRIRRIGPDKGGHWEVVDSSQN